MPFIFCFPTLPLTLDNFTHCVAAIIKYNRTSTQGCFRMAMIKCTNVDGRRDRIDGRRVLKKR